jgi:hypothetical protein
MIYGRRVLEAKKFPNNLAFAKSKTFEKSVSAQTNLSQYYYKDLTFKHVIACVLCAVGSLILFLGPSVYFLHDNYTIFYQLAFESQPELVHHLERELVWFYVLAGFACFSGVFTTAWLVSRLMHSLLMPLKNLEKHLNQNLQGQWSEPPKVKEGAEFRGILESYAHLHLQIKTLAAAELAQLELLQIDNNDRMGLSIKSQLIENRKKMLNRQEPENVISLGEDSFSLHSKRRVS